LWRDVNENARRPKAIASNYFFTTEDTESTEFRALCPLFPLIPSSEYGEVASKTSFVAEKQA